MEEVMSVLFKIAYFQNRKDEKLNQELAIELAKSKNKDDIKELIDNLSNQDLNIRNDCIKVVYEIGFIDPSLINGYAEVFIKLLDSPDNRMVWGAMIALSTIAKLSADMIVKNKDKIIQLMQNGSVITVDNAVKTLAGAASVKQEYNMVLFPFLFSQLSQCRPASLPQYAESIFSAVNHLNKNEYLGILKDRLSSLNPAQAARINKLIRKLG
jgi:hypothetical protein